MDLERGRQRGLTVMGPRRRTREPKPEARLTAYQAFRTTSYRHRTERRPALQASLEPLNLAFDEQRLVAISAPH